MGLARAYKAYHNYHGDDLKELSYAATHNKMYLAHEAHVPKKLERSSHTSWTFTDLTFGSGLPAPTGVAVTVTNPNQDSANNGNAYFPQPASYVVTAFNSQTGQQSVASSSASGTNDLSLKRNKNTITWNAVSGATGYKIYKADNTQAHAYVGQTTQTSFVDDNIQPDLLDTPPIAYNPFSSTNNYPSTVMLFEQRTWWARTNNNVNAVWSSRSADYENMDYSEPRKGDDGLEFAVVSDGVNAINNMLAMKRLMLLSENGTKEVIGANDDFLTPVPPPKFSEESGIGSSRLRPIRIQRKGLYQASKGYSVRALNYTFEYDGYEADDMTIFSSHLVEGFEIVSWTYSEVPFSCVWAVRNDGKLLCFTWEQKQQVWGWTLCETDGLVKSVCSILENGEDRVYLIVERTIQGSGGGTTTRRYVERMASGRWETIEETCFLDSARTYDFSTATKVLYNLGHLEGVTCNALVDGLVVTGLVPSGGSVTLPRAGKKITIGRPYRAVVQSLKLAYQDNGGSTEGKVLSPGKAYISLKDTLGIKAGLADAPDDLYHVKSEGVTGSKPRAMLNGVYEIEAEPLVSDSQTVVVVQENPLPMTLTGMFLDASRVEDYE